jgi:hypothetical protein
MAGGGEASRQSGTTEMANGEKVRRTLHLKMTVPTADPAHLLPMVQAAMPFYEFFGGTRVRLLQNVDDPAKFIQEIEYETDEALELNRQRIASDLRIQTYLQTWRAMLGSAVEVDVYEDVTGKK